LKLSVIIPAEKGSGTLERCLESLSSSHHPAHEVLVVGDQIADQTRQMARPQGFMVYGQGAWKGRWAGRNLGAALSSGEILVFLDPEIRIRAETLSRIIEHFSAGRAEVVLGIPAFQPLQDSFISRYESGRMHRAHVQSSEMVPWTSTSLMAMERSLFFQLGGFRGNFNIPLDGRDMEFGERVIGAGFSIFLDKKLEVDYDERLSLGRVLRNDFRASSAAVQLVLVSRGFANSRGSRGVVFVPFKLLASVLLAALLAVSLVVSPWISWAPRWALLWLLLYVLAEVRLLRFYRDAFGRIFAGKALLVGLMDHLACGLGMVLGVGRFWWKR